MRFWSRKFHLRERKGYKNCAIDEGHSHSQSPTQKVFLVHKLLTRPFSVSEKFGEDSGVLRKCPGN